MNINDILQSLGLDFTNPEVKRGAIEAIEAIINSRVPQGAIGGAPGGGEQEDVEIDPDLIQPSQKYDEPQSNADIEIEDEEDILSQIKRNESEDDIDDGGDIDRGSSAAGNSNSESSASKSDSSTDDSNNREKPNKEQDHETSKTSSQQSEPGSDVAKPVDEADGEEISPEDQEDTGSSDEEKGNEGEGEEGDSDNKKPATDDDEDTDGGDVDKKASDSESKGSEFIDQDDDEDDEE